MAVGPRNIAWFIFAVTPLGLLTGTFLSHDVMPKVILVLSGAALLLFLLPRWSGGFAQLRANQRGRWFLWLAAAQGLLLAASTLFSTQPLVSFAGTTWRRFGMMEQLATLVIACCIAACSVRSAKGQPDSIRPLWRAVVVCGGVAAIYGISQYFGLDPFLDRRLYAIDYLGGIVRPPATMGHAIYFSAYLVPVGLIAAWQAIEEMSVGWRLLHAAVAALAPLAILLSGSRGALLGLAGGALVLTWFRRPSRKLAGLGAGAVLAVAALVAFSPMGENLRHRIAQWREDPGSVRVAVWRESPVLIAKAPWLGSGPETFAAAFRAVESVELSRAYPDFINETPHNAFVDAACAEGLPGALILAGLFALGLGGKGSPGLRAAMAGMLICSLFASFSLVTGMYLWAIAGISAAEETPAKVAQNTSYRGKILAPFGIAAGVAFLALAILLSVQDAAYADLGRAVDARDLPQARLDLARATSFGLGMPGYELWGSQEMSKLKAWSEARDAAALAEGRGEDPSSAAYQASILQIVNGDAGRAEAKAGEAIVLAPNWYKPHLLRAQILQAMGRNAEAAQEARSSMALGWKGK
ncbi:MAG TPA: O-antigen ligase family protein [Bryobacteraceae bacterium]|jgi:O-antigen ligase|nr:O-antigen ligase family protein [Bryobacteraceae bacterium]